MSPIESHSKGLLARLDFLPGGIEHINYDHIIVATGPDWDITKSNIALIQQILRDGIAIPDPFGGFSTQNFELTSSPNIFGMGANVRGEDFAVHSLPALARHTKAIEACIRRRYAAKRNRAEPEID